MMVKKYAFDGFGNLWSHTNTILKEDFVPGEGAIERHFSFRIKNGEFISQSEIDKWVKQNSIIYRDKFVFTATIYINELYKGNSSVSFACGVKAPNSSHLWNAQILVTDFNDLLPEVEIKRGVISGEEWTFVKRGVAQGIKLYRKGEK